VLARSVCVCDLGSMTLFQPMLLATLLVHALAAWKPTCNGEFQCSSLSSPDFALWKSVDDNGIRECLYGHTEATRGGIDGQCERPCSGVRTAPCRCQTAAEAQLKNSKAATFNMWVSVSITLFAVIATCCVCQCLASLDAKVHGEDICEGGESEVREDVVDMEAASDVNAEHVPTPLCFGGDLDVVMTPSTSSSNHVVGASGPRDGTSVSTSVPSSESTSSIRKKLQGWSRVVEGSAVGVFNKYKLVNWFFPCLLAGGLAYGVHVGLAHFEDGSYYHQLSEVMKIVAVACGISAFLLVIRASIADTFCLCFGRMLTSALMILLVVGMASLAWSAKQLSETSQTYFACEARQCIFGLC